MSEVKARELLIERAAIEFDPAVVTAFLSLGHLDELRSFAKTEEAPEPAETDHGLALFSSFMR
jgi:hypothetical protein